MSNPPKLYKILRSKKSLLKFQRKVKRELLLIKLKKPPIRVCGIDTSYKDEKAVTCCVIFSDKSQRLEEVTFHVSFKLKDYIPTYFSLRELEPSLKALKKAKVKPDLIFINACGINHPITGLASHIGYLTKIPTIGVTKETLVGKVGEEIRCNQKVKAFRLLHENLQVGWKIEREGHRPIYVSPGDYITLPETLNLSLKFLNNSFPFPLSNAHTLSKHYLKLI